MTVTTKPISRRNTHVVIWTIIAVALFAGILLFSKSRNRIKSDEFIHWTDQEVIQAYDTTSDQALKEKLRKEQKARGLRNQRKRGK